jgi:predicted RNA-binding protein with EMAP domain
MTNYEKVAQWAATLKSENAFNELQNLKLKYPWLKCDESLAFLKRMNEDLPKIASIVKHQEKQNAIHRKFIEVSKMTDAGLVEAITKQYGL